MIKKKHQIRRGFTLMEVIVAMAVFSVMMGLLMQMFLGAQKLWAAADNKNELYSDARVAMDLFSSTLQSQYYDPGSSMFLFGSSNGNTDAMIFPVKMPVDYGSEEEIYYLSFLWKQSDHTLYMRTYGKKDGKANYQDFFAPTGHDSGQITAKANKLRTNGNLVSNDPANDSHFKKVISGILELSFKPVHAYPGNSSSVTFYSSVDDTLNVRGSSTDTREISPFAVQISIKMLSKRHYDEWKALGGGSGTDPEAAQRFRLANLRQFDRIVYLGFK